MKIIDKLVILTLAFIILLSRVITIVEPFATIIPVFAGFYCIAYLVIRGIQDSFEEVEKYE